VWSEIQSLGERVAEPLYATLLQEVVDRFTQRSIANLNLLVSRLSEEGFLFLGDDRVTNAPWDRPNESTRTWLHEFEKSAGFLPAILRAWWEQVGSVSFLGRHDFLCPVAEDPFGSVRYADPMQIFPPSGDPSANLDVLELGYSKRLKALAAEEDSGWEVRLPQRGGDCRVTEFGSSSKGVWFSAHIRTCFEWGGFPGWAAYKRRPKQLDAMIAGLTEGLLPV
jgi:hypothetical protein